MIGNLFFPGCTFRELSISTTSGTTDANSVNGTAGTVAGYMTIIRAAVLTATTSYYLVANSNPAVTTVNPVFYAVRIG